MPHNIGDITVVLRDGEKEYRTVNAFSALVPTCWAHTDEQHCTVLDIMGLRRGQHGGAHFSAMPSSAEEIQHTIDRLLRFKRKARIDLEEPDRMALILPDVLATLEESERAQDPFFGMMGPGYELPSPSTLVQQWQLEKEPFPEPPVPVLPAPENGITASPESITITEAAAVPEAEFEGVELPQVTPTEMDIIEMLMEQQDEFPGEEEERELVREMETEVTREEPAPVVSAERLRVTAAEDEETMWLLDEETGLPVEVPVAVPVEKTPTRVTLPPSPPEREAEEPRDVRRERERVGEMERVLPR
uniref:Uncharacterized protein n=1 Tax=Scleropages formosus TaxID=113540 RepID=A0A8C9WNG6_SCLFO